MVEFEKLQEIIAGVMHVDAKTITEDTVLMEDLGADSLDVFEIIMGIEDTFQIEAGIRSLDEVTTVGEVYDLIRQTVRGNGR